MTNNIFIKLLQDYGIIISWLPGRHNLTLLVPQHYNTNQMEELMIAVSSPISFEGLGIGPCHEHDSSIVAHGGAQAQTSFCHSDLCLVSQLNSVQASSTFFIQGISAFLHQLGSDNLFGFICLHFCTCSCFTLLGGNMLQNLLLIVSYNILEGASGLFTGPKSRPWAYHNGV